MDVEIKKAVIVFFLQFALYTMLCINIRAVSHADYSIAVITDILIASSNFYIFRKIAREPNETSMFIGYVVGSAVGSVAGIRLSVFLSQ